MDLERSGKLLTSTSNYYDIGIIEENGNKITVHRKIQPGKEGPEFLKQVIQDYRPKQVFIDVFKPSGNSKHLETTLTIDVTPELLAGPNEEYTETFDIDEMNNLPAAAPGQWFHHVIADQKELIQELKETKRRLESETDKLRRDKGEIEKELAFKDKETELKIRAIEQEHSYKEAAHENSLGSVGARMMENPAMAQVLMGVATKIMSWGQPQQPLQMQGPETMGMGQQGPALDSDMQQIVTWIQGLPSEKKAKFFQVVQACSVNMFLIDDLAELVQNEEVEE